MWGQRKSYDWYCDVLELLHFTLSGDEDIGRKQIVSQVIELQVAAVVYKSFAYNSHVPLILMDDWKYNFFHKRYTGEESLFDLTVQSEQRVPYRMAQFMSNP